MGLSSVNPIRVVLGWAYRGLTGGFLLLQNFSVAISVCLFYLNFNFDFYVSKIMHLCVRNLPRKPNN